MEDGGEMTWETLKDVMGRLDAGSPPPPWAGLFGASPRPEDCAIVILPVPWDATVSYGEGTAKAPDQMTGASHQLDLEDPVFTKPYRAGITMLPTPQQIQELNAAARTRALRILASHGDKAPDKADLKFVNDASLTVNAHLYDAARTQLQAGRIAAVLGGDHSSPFGLIRALAEKHPDGFGILHFDAHHDLREAYEGFEHSHASIMFNVMEQVRAVKTLVQVGIRDYSQEERSYAMKLAETGRGKTFYGRDLFQRKARGETWAQTAKEILAALPQKVYVSFDIDGLDPAFCPTTGTPVPGGLSYDEALFLVEEVALQGKTIVGFDLVEVGAAEWDANVGARVLYKLCGATLHANGLL